MPEMCNSTMRMIDNRRHCAHSQFYFISILDDICLGDTSRKFGSITPRHTIDAILGLKNRERMLESE